MTKKDLLGTESLADKMKKVKEEMALKNEEVKAPKPSSSLEKIPPKLFVNGRLDRKKQKYTARSLILLNAIDDEIKTYCKGGELAILNFLIKEGLESVKRAESPINVDMIDIEMGGQ